LTIRYNGSLLLYQVKLLGSFAYFLSGFKPMRLEASSMYICISSCVFKTSFEAENGGQRVSNNLQQVSYSCFFLRAVSKLSQKTCPSASLPTTSAGAFRRHIILTPFPLPPPVFIKCTTPFRSS